MPFLFFMKNTEIERKFLVLSDAFMAQASKQYEIVQGYLCREPGKTIRVRIRDAQAFLTIKSGKLRPGIGKFEWEREIDPDDAKELIQLCLPDPIIKTRYIVGRWEVDVFHSGKMKGTTLAEIELSDENEPFDRPEWLGEEVTGQPQYYNANM